MVVLLRGIKIIACHAVYNEDAFMIVLLSHDQIILLFIAVLSATAKLGQK